MPSFHDLAQPESDPLSRAEAVYSGFVGALEAGESVDFEALLTAHPDLEGELRELHASWQWIEACRKTQDLAEPESASAAGGGERYSIDGEIGQGGMGVVLAVWDRELRRKLAMKVCRISQPGSDAPSAVRRSHLRFLEEAQITAQLDHPGVVPIHELGTDADGHVYFTMRKVEGRTLGAVFELVEQGAEGWTLPRAVGVLVQVCETLSFAHARGVIHRDLKPANVMVGQFGEVYVMDWGLAKVLGAAPDAGDPVRSVRAEAIEVTPESSLHTLDGAVIGTPGYMSPEQADGQLEQLGPATDVYAVGAMLYHLLAGKRPYAEVRSERLLGAIRSTPPLPLDRMGREVPAELMSICARAMARRPDDRYPTMAALGGDLRAFLEQRVVSAHGTGVLAEVRKWVARNRFLAGALVAAAALVTLAGALAFQGQRAALDGQRALFEAEQEQVRELTAANEARRAESYTANLAVAAQALEEGNVEEARRFLAACPEELRGWEWTFLESRLDLSAVTYEVTEDPAGLMRFDVYESSGWLAAAAWDEVVVLDLETRERIATLPHTRESFPFFRPDGEQLWVYDNGQRIVAYATDSWEPVETVELFVGGGHTDLAFSPDGARYAVTEGRWLEVRAVDDHRVLATLEENLVHLWSVVWSPDGTRLAVSAMGDLVHVLDPDTAAPTLTIEALPDQTPWGIPWDVAWSPDGARLAGGLGHGQVKTWDAATGELVDYMRYGERWINDVCFVSDRQLAVASNNGTLGLLDLEERRVEQRFRGHADPWVREVQVSQGGGRIYTAGRDGTVRLWHANSRDRQTYPGENAGGRALALSNGGLRFAAVDDQQRVIVRDDARSETVFELAALWNSGIALNASGDTMYASLGPGRHGSSAVSVVDGETGRTRHKLSAPGSAEALALHPSERWLACKSKTTGELIVWDLEERALVRRVPDVGGAAGAPSFDAEGGRMVHERADGRLQVWSFPALEELTTLGEPGALGQSATFLPDGRRVASFRDGVVSIRNVETGAVARRIDVGARHMNAISFTPDGERMLTCSYFPLRLWDVDSGRLAHSLEERSGRDNAIFDPLGEQILVHGNNRMVELLARDRRVERDALRQRAAAHRDAVRPLVEGLFARHELVRDVVHALERRPDLGDERLLSALRLARSRVERPEALDAVARGLLDDPAATPKDLQRALRHALAACEYTLDLAPMQHTLARALLATGDHAQALEVARYADELNLDAAAPYPRSRDLALSALAFRGLGEHEESERLLGEVRALLAETADAMTARLLER